MALWRSQVNPTHLALQISLFGFEPLTKDRLITRLRQTNGLSPVRSLRIHGRNGCLMQTSRNDATC